MIKKLLAHVCALLFGSLFANDVVIVGGGPAGLATAIEARMRGSHVTIIEKRKQYVRDQRVFISQDSLALLDKWKVKVPEMIIAEGSPEGEEVPPGDKVGIIQLKILEERLAERVSQLNIPVVYGEFQGIIDQEVIISTDGQDRRIPYDILVGADGARSRVRKNLGIETSCTGNAKGAVVFFQTVEDSGMINVSPSSKKGDIYGKKVVFPYGNMILIQAASSPLNNIAKIIEELGWKEEGNMLECNAPTFCLQDIEIMLQQAHTFSDSDQSAILVGDAAAIASFYLGSGANSAFQSAVLAGNFLQKFQEDRDAAFDLFNSEMKKASDALIEESRFLFTEDGMPEESRASI